MKGMKLNDAEISGKHGNFIINNSEARAEDVISLMKSARSKVKESNGIVLEPEIKLWGFPEDILEL